MKFRTIYTAAGQMIERIGTCHVYPVNERTSDAVCQLEWAYAALDKPDMVYPSNRTMHEWANIIIEEHEDVLLDHLCIKA